MGSILDIHVPWRDGWLPAHFDNRLFHMENGARTSGRRIVTHQFPKKDTPYSEDMGRIATSFDVKGYIITFGRDTGLPLYMRDYRIARDQLMERLDQRAAGVLQLPTMEPMLVVCSGYRWSEDQKAGGFCEFSMQFVEWGAPPFRELPDSGAALRESSQALKGQVLALLARPTG